MKTITLNSFRNGMTANVRDNDSAFCRLCKHFDNTTDPHVLTPYREADGGDSSASTHKIANFCYTGTTMYGLGVQTGTALAKIFTKSDFSGDSWGQLTNGEDSDTGVTQLNDLFIPYRIGANTFIYGATTGRIWKARADGGAAWVTTELTVSIGEVTQGLVHSKDNVLYIGYDNQIAENDAGSWSATALSLPATYIVTSLAEYGNYLAIGARSTTSGGRSIVYLWDRDSSLATVSESVDWGTGDLMVVEQIEGYLIGVSIEYSSVALDPKIVFRMWNGGPSATVFRTIRASQQFTSVSLKKNKQKVNNKLYFMMTIVMEGETHEGVWSISRSSPYDTFSVTFSHLPNNDTGLTSGVLNGFYLLGDYMFISYQSSGAYGMSLTDNLANYDAASSIYDTLINPGMPTDDRFRPKKLYSVRVSFVPLPAAGQVTLQYRADAELNDSWTDILTVTTDGQVTAESTVDSSGASFTDATEYQFRIKSKGGAQITGLAYRYETLNSLT